MGLKYWLSLVPLMAVILAAALGIALPSSGEEILLYTQQPYSIRGNLSLVVEDVDPRAGVVWLKLYTEDEILKSALLSHGEHLHYDELDLTVSKIYAGGERDLIALELNNSSAVNSSRDYLYHRSSASPPDMKKSPGSGALALLVAILGRAIFRAK